MRADPRPSDLRLVESLRQIAVARTNGDVGSLHADGDRRATALPLRRSVSTARNRAGTAAAAPWRWSRMVASSCACVLRLERTAAGERGQLREQRRTRLAQRDRIHHDVRLARAIAGVGRARLAVAVVAVRQQHQRAPALRGLDGVDRRDDRVVQSSGAPALESLDGVLLRAAVRGERGGDLDLAIRSRRPWPGRSDAGDRGTPRAASRAIGSCRPPMLKLRSMASATESGKSPAAKAETACGRPSSSTVKSSRVRPVTGRPSRSTTAAYTSTRLTPDANWAGMRRSAR